MQAIATQKHVEAAAGCLSALCLALGQGASEVVFAQVQLLQPGDVADKAQNVGDIFTVQCGACGERKLGDI